MPNTTPQPPAKTISELVANPDFPNSAIGENVDIKGFTGVVVEIVKNSLKVHSVEGITMSYNFHALRRLYGPRPEPAAEPAPPESTPTPPVPPPAPPEPKRDIILEPNYDLPVVPIEALIHRADFPKCAFGQFIDLHGYSGVVVELVGRSLKVRSPEGSTRSYNGDGLLRIYAKPAVGSPTNP